MPTPNNFISLLAEFVPEHVQVDDISYQHAGGPDAQSHFYLELVSASFVGQSLLQRQRRVHAALRPLAGQYHALALRLYTPEEWRGQGGRSLSRAPECAHQR